MRLGVLGGTFNPVHNGHLAIARQTADALSLDRILFVPTKDPAHKPANELAPARERYEMVRLAIASDPRFTVSDIELRREGTSYSIDTVRQLQQEYGPETHLYFLIGLDAFLDLALWREPETLLSLCSFVVISRPGLSFKALSGFPLIPPLPHRSLAELDTGVCSRLDMQMGSQSLICLRLPPCDISASTIRANIKQHRSTANLLPPVLESYILQHHIYE